jgi:hypothetical protein
MYLIDLEKNAARRNLKKKIYLRVKKLVMDFCFVLPGGEGCLTDGLVSILGTSSVFSFEIGVPFTSFSSQVSYSLVVTR